MATATHDEHATEQHEGHHVPPAWIFHAVFGALLVLTALTYAASTVHLGRTLNVTIALLIATVKASLVCMFFMHLWWDKKFNTVVLLVSVGFLALFIGLATLDTVENAPHKDPTFAEREMARLRKEKGITYHTQHEDAAGGHEAGSAGQDELRGLARWAKETFGPLPEVAPAPADNPLTDAKVKLGQMLYFDARLSKNHDVSCNSCHLLDRFGVDGEPTSRGHRGQRGGRNAPTTLNAALQFAQFWDGRAANVDEQAKGPILNPIEMAMPSEDAVVGVLRSIPGYAPLFQAAFPSASGSSITYDNLAKAIGSFERKLMTPGRFDAFMEGELDALSPEEVEGLKTFRSVGCIQCHNGPLLGGRSYEKIGKVVPYPTQDRGRAEVTGSASDEFVFKVPQLRNVARTGPWFHDGKVGSLEEAVRLMGKHQLGQELSTEQVQSIVTFLKALEGKVPPALATAPELPPSGPTTPAPDPN
ncbi:MAG: hypothetical protein D6731_21215 [Planctomycetota bacterium]|nr:MAG: hypothetical protein D6731_21215 [Planctomycetota bacterium]